MVSVVRSGLPPLENWETTRGLAVVVSGMLIASASYDGTARCGPLAMFSGHVESLINGPFR